ncbi:hypothetical protein D3C80_805120 [compost metagenome]
MLTNELIALEQNNICCGNCSQRGGQRFQLSMANLMRALVFSEILAKFEMPY